MTGREARAARLGGRLRVLLGVRDELEAIGAPASRRERNSDEIERVRDELARLGDPLGDRCGNSTDATRGPGS